MILLNVELIHQSGGISLSLMIGLRLCASKTMSNNFPLIHLDDDDDDDSN
jgi:hypothetical protein